MTGDIDIGVSSKNISEENQETEMILGEQIKDESSYGHSSDPGCMYTQQKFCTKFFTVVVGNHMHCHSNRVSPGNHGHSNSSFPSLLGHVEH